MVDLCLRQILMDRLTLRDYAAGDSVSWMDIRRRLMLNEREVDPTIPDHLYRSALVAQVDEQGIDSLSKYQIYSASITGHIRIERTKKIFKGIQ